MEQKRGAHGRSSEGFEWGSRRLKAEEWPASDRAAWVTATTRAGPLDPPGAAAHLASETMRARAGAWGQYLGFLIGIGELWPHENVGDRLTIERLSRFITARRGTVSDNSLYQILRELRQIAEAMAPDRDFSWVLRHPLAPGYLDARASRKEPTVLDAPVLLNAADAVMDGISDSFPTVQTSRRFRDALIVSLVMYHPLRRANLASLRLGRHVTREHEVWRISVPEEETKNYAAVDVPLATRLTPYFDRYIDIHRPRLLLGGRTLTLPENWAASFVDGTGGALWVNNNGAELAYAAYHSVMSRAGMALLGRPINVHAFRHTAATVLRQSDPTTLKKASAALGHRSTKVTERDYDHSGSAPAVAIFTDLMSRIRRGDHE